MGQRCQKVAAFTCKSFLMFFNVYLWVNFIFILYFFNIVTSGVFIFATGIIVHFQLKQYFDLSEDVSIAAPLIFIGTGFVISVVAIVACYCTIKNQPGLLYIYAIFIAISFAIQLGVCILAYAYREPLKEQFHQGLNDTLVNYNIDYDRTSSFDKLQSTMHCCGVDSYEDFYKVSYGKVPGSCCKQDMTCDTKNLQLIYKTGCFTVVIDMINAQLIALMGCVIGLSFLHMLGIVIAISLANMKVKCVRYEEPDEEVAEKLLKEENEEYEKYEKDN